jgi:hypothetical protein
MNSFHSVCQMSLEIAICVSEQKTAAFASLHIESAMFVSIHVVCVYTSQTRH